MNNCKQATTAREAILAISDDIELLFHEVEKLKRYTRQLQKRVVKIETMAGVPIEEPKEEQ